VIPKAGTLDGTLHSFENMGAAGRLPNYKSSLSEQDYAEMIWLAPRARTRGRALVLPEMIGLAPKARTHCRTLRTFEYMIWQPQAVSQITKVT